MPSFRSLKKLAVILLLGSVGGLAQARDSRSEVVVPEQVAALVRPILDLRAESVAECGEPGTPTAPKCLTGEGYERNQDRSRKVAEGVARLIAQRGKAADEALVVLMCYYTGESGDDEDGVINRGHRELPYLIKYRGRTPVIPQRGYLSSMLLSRDVKKDSFRTAINAIEKGERRD
jgi:hypothetical protein